MVVETERPVEQVSINARSYAFRSLQKAVTRESSHIDACTGLSSSSTGQMDCFFYRNLSSPVPSRWPARLIRGRENNECPVGDMKFLLFPLLSLTVTPLLSLAQPSPDVQARITQAIADAASDPNPDLSTLVNVFIGTGMSSTNFPVLTVTYSS